MGRVAVRPARRLLAVVLLAVVALLPTVPVPVGAQDDPAADQRVVKLVGTYEIQPERRRVEVTEQITVSNVRQSQRSGSTITTFFWTGHTVWVPTDAEDLTIEVAGQPLEWEVVDTVSGVDVIGADYRRNLNFGQTRVIDVAYTLPTYRPGRGTRRINEALFDVELLVCCNFEEVDLTVTVPASFEVAPPDDLAFQRRDVGERQQYVFADNEVTGRFTEVLFTQWSGIDDAALRQASASVGSGTVEVRYPPDDEGWSAATVTLVEETGTAMAELIGDPWSVDRLVLQQGPSATFGPWGSTGPFDGPIAVPRDGAEEAVVATVVRAGLVGGPFEDPIIVEGLTADLAAEVVRRWSDRIIEPRLPPGPTGDGPDTDLAFRAVRQVSDEIGHGGLGRLIQMAAAGETAYVGRGSIETSATIPGDWRRFVDLAQHRLGSQSVTAALVEVLDEQEATLLAERDEVVETYLSLRDRAGGEMPVGIRTAMTNWELDTARVLLGEADGVLAERRRVLAEAEERGQAPEVELGSGWASAETVDDLAAVRASILDREAALTRSGWWGTVGVVALGVVGAAALGVGLLALLRSNRRRKSITPM